MSSLMWYESTPTVMSQDGTTTYIYPTAEMRAALAKQAPEWVEKADRDGTPIRVVTRAAVAGMLSGVDAKAITDAKLKAETTDVAAPLSGTFEAKEKAVQAKLSTVLSVAEYEKLEALRASVKVEEKPVDEIAEKVG